MKISWYGHSCFKMTTKSTTIITDPFNKEIGLKPPHCEADIVSISHNHKDHNNFSTLRGDPFLIESPGEYDLRDIAIRGTSSFHDSKEGKERGSNIIFTFKIEDIKICHLGDLGQKELTSEQLESIDNVDILMIPVGGVYTINGEQAMNIINQIEPKIIIPMHYKLPKLKIKIEPVDQFLKETGTKEQRIDCLTIKKEDLSKEEEKTQVIVMNLI